jgi:acetyl-CoA synthetase
MEIIRKTPHDYRVQPNLTDYENARARIHWSDVPALCEGMGPGKCNKAYAAVDRHAASPNARRTARFATTFCCAIRSILIPWTG